MQKHALLFSFIPFHNACGCMYCAVRGIKNLRSLMESSRDHPCRGGASGGAQHCTVPMLRNIVCHVIASGMHVPIPVPNHLTGGGRRGRGEGAFAMLFPTAKFQKLPALLGASFCVDNDIKFQSRFLRLCTLPRMCWLVAPKWLRRL